MHYLYISLSYAMVMAGLLPVSHAQHGDTEQQLFGSCSQDDVNELFGNYSEVCSKAYRDVDSVMASEKLELERVVAAYTTICSENCLKPVMDFHHSCNAGSLTEVVHRACERNSNELCVLGFMKNGGMMANDSCSGVRITRKCTESCRGVLLELAKDHGCCVNSLLDVGAFGYSLLGAENYQVWSLCQVELPPKCGQSSGSKSVSTNVLPFIICTGMLLALYIYEYKWI